MKFLLTLLLLVSTGITAFAQDKSADEAASRLIKKKREKIRTTTTTETVKKPEKESGKKTDE